MFRKHIVSCLCLTVFVMHSYQVNAQSNLKKTVGKVNKTVVKGACDGSQKSLKKYLKMLEDKAAAGESGKSSFKTYIGSAERAIKSIRSKCPDLDISKEMAQLNSYKSGVTSTDNKDAERKANIRKGYYDKAIDKLVPETHPAHNDFYRARIDLLANLPYIYSESPNGARGAKGLKDFTGDWVYKTEKMFASFSVSDFKARIESAKKNGTYPRVQFYAEKFHEALDDYPSFIQKSQGMFNTYIDYLNDTSVKGNPQKEIEQLKRTQLFCKLLLKFAPNNPKATQWLKQVESQIGSKASSISYDSHLHKKYLGKMLFSKKEVTIGNESESDFTTNFKSRDYIYITLYLPTKARELTDSYAMNNMDISINGGMISNPTNTAVRITTPMQEKNYLRFPLLPTDQWKQKNGKPYFENDIRTFEHTLNGLMNAGPYADVQVDVKLKFRQPGQVFKGSFKIDMSAGQEPLKKMLSNIEHDRLKSIKLPKAGMVDSNLQNQALAIMRKRSEGSGKTYYKAIITSSNWEYERSYAGVITARTLEVVLVSKEYDGKCMYQHLGFKQQAKGGGSYNSNLEFAGAGAPVYMSCDNVN